MARVGRSQTVESYLRKFRGDETAYSEILEITLCYGIQCLSREFPFHGGGLTCSDLRTITGQRVNKYIKMLLGIKLLASQLLCEYLIYLYIAILQYGYSYINDLLLSRLQGTKQRRNTAFTCARGHAFVLKTR